MHLRYGVVGLEQRPPSHNPEKTRRDRTVSRRLDLGRSFVVLPTDPELIRSVIQQQLEAFQQDDAEGAFAFASPAIQAQFGTPETFMQMVKTGYVPVYRPRAVIFAALTTVEDMPAQTVMLMSENEELVQAVYLMQQQPNGNWRIHGCFLTPVSGRAD